MAYGDAPVCVMREIDGQTLINDEHPDDCGNIQIGTIGESKQLQIVNNPLGTLNVPMMEDVTITTVTKNGLESGDTPANGKDVVEQNLMLVRSITNNEEIFIAIGGPDAKALANIRGDKLNIPTALVGEASHGSGGRVNPNSYFGVISAVDETGETNVSEVESNEVVISPMVEMTSEEAASETLDTTTYTKIAQLFLTDGLYINGASLKMATGGTLEGNIRIETDNSGEPSGTLAHANLLIENVTLTPELLQDIFTLLEGTVTDVTSLWLILEITSGSGQLKGTTSGTADQVKIWNGSAWVLSSNIENLTFRVLNDNKINWSWAAVTNAEGYRLYRTTESGEYVSPCLVADEDEIEGESYSDGKDVLETGQPIETETTLYEHFHLIERKMASQTNTTYGAVQCYWQVRYMFATA